ncbi:subtilisin-like protein [Thozetella sp. PMI_491]|nr:subtilisin-like protein [Thozetella sp. PMI_491]
MLFRSLVAAFGLGLAIEVVASPLLNVNANAIAKREVPSTHVLHERHAEHMSKYWTKRSQVPRDMKLPMRIGLTQSNLDAGRDRLTAISDPKSEHYGKHMTSDDVVKFFAPSETTVQAVLEWLVSAGISRNRIGLSANKQWMQFDATAEEAGELLVTDFYYFEDPTGEHRDIGVSEYHIPVSVREHVDYITPGIRLRGQSSKRAEKKAKRADRSRLKAGKFVEHMSKQTPVPQSVAPAAGKGLTGVTNTTCATYLTYDCVQAQYGIPNGTTKAAGNQLGIFEDLGDHYSTKDLDSYLTTLTNIPSGTRPENRLIDGAIGSEEDLAKVLSGVSPGFESNLDFQSAMPIIYPQTTVLFQTNDEYWEEVGTPGFFNTFLDAIDGSYCTYSAYGETGDATDPDFYDPIYPNTHWSGGWKSAHQCGVYQPTNVISISYDGIEYYVPDSYQKRQCDEYMKLGLQGVTVVLSSGDYGVSTWVGCIDDTVFTPLFPATCPYILTVGSTELNRFDTSIPATPYEKLDEVATTSFPSGGGFSNVFPMPDFQKDAVSAYLAQVSDTLSFGSYDQIIVDGDFSGINETSQVYNIAGRAYPDVSMVGDRFLVAYEQAWYFGGGTSLSTPFIASMLTLVNEKRIAAGKSTLGFITPTLYAHPEIFNDVTVGSNPGCDTDGFPAASGWDPVTGLGSPKYADFEALLVAL